MDIAIKTTFNHSEPLNHYIEGRLLAARRSFLGDVQQIVLRLSDANGPRHGANDKVVLISARLRSAGPIITTATSADIYRSVDQAIDRLRSALRRHGKRMRSRRHRVSTGSQAHRGH